MALIVLKATPTAQHSVTTAYSLAKIHWSAVRPGSSASVLDGSGALIASLSDKVTDVSFNPPKAVTGLRIVGANSGFLHIYTQDVSGFGG